MQTSTLITLTLSLLALSVSATPPACLLAAINEQATPSDLKALCGTLENAVVGNITEKCVKDTLEDAVSSYKSTCLEGAGVTITITSPSSSSSFASATTTGTTKASGSATATASGTGARITGSENATVTSGSTTSATGSAAAATVTAAGNAGSLAVPGFLGIVGLVGAFLF